MSAEIISIWKQVTPKYFHKKWYYIFFSVHKLQLALRINCSGIKSNQNNRRLTSESEIRSPNESLPESRRDPCLEPVPRLFLLSNPSQLLNQVSNCFLFLTAWLLKSKKKNEKSKHYLQKINYVPKKNKAEKKIQVTDRVTDASLGQIDQCQEMMARLWQLSTDWQKAMLIVAIISTVAVAIPRPLGSNGDWKLPKYINYTPRWPTKSPSTLTIVCLPSPQS